jgi:TP901 family phage tail tape measure protein
METIGSKIVAEGADAYISAMNGARDAHGDFVRGVESGAGQVNGALDRSKGGVSGFKEIFTGALREIGAVAVSALAEAGRQIGQFVVDSIGAAGDFEAGMNNFAAAAGQDVDAKGLKEFENLFIDIGKRLPVSTADVQSAALALVKGGLDPATVAAGALESSIKFATASQMDLTEASELSVKSLALYGDANASAADQTEFLTKTQDMMVKVAGASTVDVDKLGQAYLAAGGAAKSSGVEQDDFLTAMGMIVQVAPSAAEAGTSYKNFLNRLTPTTKDATKMMIDLGLATKDGETKFYDANGAFIGNKAAAELLNKSMAGLTDVQKAQAMETIFGSDAMIAANALTSAGADGYQDFADNVAKANGVQGQSAATQKGYAFELENLKGSFEALQIVIGMALLPVLSSLLSTMSAGVGQIIEFVQQFVAAPDQIGFLQAAISGFLPSVDSLGVVFTTAQTTIATVMASLQSTITVVLALVSDLWKTHGDDIMAFASEAWKSIQGIIATVVQIIGALIDAWLTVYRNSISNNMDTIKTIFGVVWDAIKLIVSTALTLIQGVLKTALALIKGDWQGAWETVKSTASTIWAGIYSALSGVFDKLVKAVNDMMADIRRKVEAALELVAKAFRDQWNEAVAIVRGVVGAAADAAGAVVNGMISRIQSAAGAIRQALVAPIEAAVAAVRGIIDGLWSSFNALKTAAANFRLPGLGGNTGTNQPPPPPGLGRGSVRATPSQASAATMGGSTTNVTRSFNLTVNSRQSAGSIVQDFAILKALAV